MTFEELREKHQSFIYKSFEINEVNGGLRLTFCFSISPDINFAPEIFFPNVSKDRLEKFDKEILNNFVFNLGLIEMISYWKATCSPQIYIKAAKLSDEQKTWWLNLLKKGLGEFYFVNKIDFKNPELVNIQTEPGENTPLFKEELRKMDLVLVGGGKDSAVTLGIFGEAKRNFNSLVVNTKTTSLNSNTALDMCRLGGCPNPIEVIRVMDPKLLELNKEGYLNGHTPFSVVLAFIGALACLLYDYQSVVVSNESSSNEGSIEYLGENINHQYAKSFEMEKEVHEYINKNLSPNINYFSFLRPLNELEISKIFSKFSKFFPVFKSCNRGLKEGIWCLNCSKCLFSFIMLYPFLGDETEKILGKNLLDDETLKSYLEELLQVPGKFKPLECVGTKEEVQHALFLIQANLEKENKKLPKLLEIFKDKFFKHPELLQIWNNEHLLPGEFESLLKEYI